MKGFFHNIFRPKIFKKFRKIRKTFKVSAASGYTCAAAFVGVETREGAEEGRKKAWQPQLRNREN